MLILPVAPLRGVGWVLNQIVLTAEQEYYDPAVVQRELKDLERSLLAGEIGETEFDRREDELPDRLAWLEQNQQRVRGRS